MEHPEFEVIENDEEISIHFRRITPIYPATEGLSQRVLRSLIHRLLQECEPDDLTALLPARLQTGAAADAWREIHFPPTEEALARARETPCPGGVLRDADAAFVAPRPLPVALGCDPLRLRGIAGAFPARVTL